MTSDPQMTLEELIARASAQVGPPVSRYTPQSLDERFAAFHRANPQVFAILLGLARRARDRGVTRLGVKAIWERMRWELQVETSGDSYHLNNNYTSRYARLLVQHDSSLGGLFEMRELRP